NNVFVIPNGVYLSDVVEEKVSFDGPSVGYLGHMGYTPNIRAAKRLYVLFKQAQKHIPNLFLVIIGRDPSPEILALADDPQVLVTGTVENIWPYVQGVDLFVFPMETGSGQQNKLLEAMAVGKPVISTTLGNSGVRAVHRESVVLADTDEELCNALIEFMSAPEKRTQLGMSGKDFVIRTYAWPSVFRQLNETLFRTVK
ncbi:MAG: glycosyltransferase, partial [Moraxellaceae bacterium]